MIFSLFILLLVSGCDTTEVSDKTLTFAWEKNAGPLNPHQTIPNQMYAQAMIYESLVKYGKEGKIEPWLAKSWSINQDATEYTFHLREDVTFSNGERFDALAVKANFDALLKNAEKLKWLQIMKMLKSTEVVDDFTVKIYFKDSYFQALQELTLIRPIRFIAPSQIPESGNTGDGIKSPIGTGPWVLESTELGAQDTFVRNENYWGNKPDIQKVIVKIIGDPNTRALALETGEVDLLYGKPGQVYPDTFKRLQSNPDYDVKLSTPFATRTITFNTTRPGLNDIAVRKAINHAVDKDSFNKLVLNGVYTTADTLFSKTVPYADIPLEPYAFDIETAKQLLNKSGWILDDKSGVRSKGDVTLEFGLLYNGKDAVMKSIAEYVQNSLDKIGIKINLVAQERSVFFSLQNKGEFDLVFNRTWGVPYEPHVFMSGMTRKNNADYEAQQGLENKSYIDELITEALLTPDDDVRRENYKIVLTELHEKAVYLPISFSGSVAISGKRVADFDMAHMTYYVPFEEMKIAN
ncbi:nickel ABC transporter substrate-binding protein [Vibrio sonorensis]|uniref:nickel ABC transporter substrate-binding protein n=1 Tax=Vibrio sonorensis TaxID=1004316 RepID=UPI0008DA342D|nr:nickel ABC transporter substrate-binding protein [Vibrio sonorensis]